MKHTILFLIMFVIITLSISSCSLLKPVADRVGEAVTKYCDNSYEDRKLLRDNVNEAVRPNQIKVWCDGDPDNPIFEDTSMKLKDLNPRFVSHGGEGVYHGQTGEPIPEQKGVGLSFDCPCGNKECSRAMILFENPLEGDNTAFKNHTTWHRTGNDFETITLHPSIQRMDNCKWHGWIRNGEVIEC